MRTGRPKAILTLSSDERTRPFCESACKKTPLFGVIGIRRGRQWWARGRAQCVVR